MIPATMRNVAPLASPTLKHVFSHSHSTHFPLGVASPASNTATSVMLNTGTMSSSGSVAGSSKPKRMTLPRADSGPFIVPQAPKMLHPPTMPAMFTPLPRTPGTPSQGKEYFLPTSSTTSESSSTVDGTCMHSSSEKNKSIQNCRRPTHSLDLSTLQSHGAPVQVPAGFAAAAASYVRTKPHSSTSNTKIDNLGLGFSNMRIGNGKSITLSTIAEETRFAETVEEIMTDIEERDREFAGSDDEIDTEEVVLKSVKDRVPTPYSRPHKKNSWLGW